MVPKGWKVAEEEHFFSVSDESDSSETAFTVSYMEADEKEFVPAFLKQYRIQVLENGGQALNEWMEKKVNEDFICYTMRHRITEEDGIYIVHSALFANVRTGVCYLAMFEGLEREWENRWNEQGDMIFKSLFFNADL